MILLLSAGIGSVMAADESGTGTSSVPTAATCATCFQNNATAGRIAGNKAYNAAAAGSSAIAAGKEAYDTAMQVMCSSSCLIPSGTWATLLENNTPITLQA